MLTLQSLPNEILLAIFSFLDKGEDYLHVLLTCQSFRAICKELSFHILTKHYGLLVNPIECKKRSLPRGISRHVPYTQTCTHTKELPFSCYQFFKLYWSDSAKKSFDPFAHTSCLLEPHKGTWTRNEASMNYSRNIIHHDKKSGHVKEIQHVAVQVDCISIDSTIYGEDNEIRTIWRCENTAPTKSKLECSILLQKSRKVSSVLHDTSHNIQNWIEMISSKPFSPWFTILYLLTCLVIVFPLYHMIFGFNTV